MTDFLLGGRGARALPRLALIASVAFLGSACDTNRFVAVTNPNSLRPGDLTNAGSVPALVNGAFRQFIGGYSGFGDDSFLSSSAVISDETYYGDSFPTRQAADSRTLQPTQLGNISNAAFARLQQARFNARRAYGVVDQFSTPSTASDDAVTKARLRAIEGYVFVTLSEGWCGDVPFISLPESGDIDPTAIGKGAPGIGTLAMNDSAVAKFNEGLSDNMAKIGLGRALLNLGKYQEAATAVASVKDDYVMLLQHSVNTSAENNPMASLEQNGRYGISNLEGGENADGSALSTDKGSATSAPNAEGLPFRGQMDIRVPFQLTGCFTGGLRCYLNDNYPNFDADVPLASGVEARLIEAEAALNRGDVATMMQKLNALRTNASALLIRLYPGRVIPEAFKVNGVPKGLDSLATPTGPVASRNLLFSERAFWLYNTGHRQGDLRRLARPTNEGGYGLTTAVFPSGQFFRGGVYGNDVAYPIPYAEQGNNKLFDASKCDNTKP